MYLDIDICKLQMNSEHFTQGEIIWFTFLGKWFKDCCVSIHWYAAVRPQNNCANEEKYRRPVEYHTENISIAKFA